MQPLVDALKQAELYLIKDIEDLENQLTSTLEKADELRAMIKQRRILLANSASVSGSGAGDDAIKSSTPGADKLEAKRIITDMDEMTREDVVSVVESDAVRSKKARTASMFALQQSKRPLTVREIMDTFSDFKLNLDHRKRKDYDLVRHAIDTCFAFKADGVRYYWPAGKDLPESFAGQRELRG